MAELGRADNINIINCGHLLDTRNDARDLDECTHITLFPQRCLGKVFNKYLQVLLALDSTTAKVIRTQFEKERIITFVKGQPIIAITESKILLINEVSLDL
jgi:hypothetical protein